MNLTAQLAARAKAGMPVRVALIGAGKFGSMFLSQIPTIPGLEVRVIADLDVERARAACLSIQWDPTRLARTQFTNDPISGCSTEDVDVVIEATGDPHAGIAHALAAIDASKPIVMVNVEADALGSSPCKESS